MLNIRKHVIRMKLLFMIKTIKDAEQEGVLENCIYNADCLDLMPHIKSKSIDMVLADLPFDKRITI
jgi:hypothetical protein